MPPTKKYRMMNQVQCGAPLKKVSDISSILPSRPLGPSGACAGPRARARPTRRMDQVGRSEEHTSELQSHSDLVCRLLLEKKKKKKKIKKRDITKQQRHKHNT